MAKVDTTDWGTGKGVAVTIVYTTAPVGAGTTTISMAAFVPAGTKKVKLFVRWNTAAAGRGIDIRPTGAGFSAGWFSVETAVAGVEATAQGDVPLDSSLQFDIGADGAATLLSIRLLEVYL